MFKRLYFNSHHDARKGPPANSLQYVTPNSRIIPPTPTESTSPSPYAANNSSNPHFSYYSYAEDNYVWDHQNFPERQSHVSRTTLQVAEDDRFGRDSIIDPDQEMTYSPGLFPTGSASPGLFSTGGTSPGLYPTGGVARGTYIEPNMSTMQHTQIYMDDDVDINDVRFDRPRLLTVDTSRHEVRTVSPPTPVKSRIKQAEVLPKMHQAHLVESPRDTENKASTNPFAPKIVVAPSKSMTGSNSSSPSRQHPQPLPPLQIPPSPIRSRSSPSYPSSHEHGTSAPTGGISPFQQESPHYLTPSRSRNPYTTAQGDFGSPGGLTTASAQSGTSPLSPSPRTPSPQNLSPSPSLSKMTPSMIADAQVEDLVAKGIKYHESGDLEKATELFKTAAGKDSPIAMFLYGVSLRHGWGAKKNEHLAFQYLQKAAEHAVLDLNGLTNTVSTSASKGELIMAIYELGVSFRHGWGCHKNKETATYFFKIAADLGDADAQNDLGHCYYHGHGVKKDLYMAAKYYRKADKQGQGIMGNSWIWKSKYDHPKH